MATALGSCRNTSDTTIKGMGPEKKENRVKSGNFGHQVNSDIRLQTIEIQMRRLLMSRLIRIFTVCLVNLCFSSL